MFTIDRIMPRVNKRLLATIIVMRTENVGEKYMEFLTGFEKEFGLMLNNEGKIVVDSVTVAEKYGKEHKNVLTKIDGFIKLIPELGQLNFKHSSYINLQSKKQPMYLMDRQGFAMLVNKFTGNEALMFTYKYTKAFEEMTKEIERLKTDNKELYKIAISNEDQIDREYKAKVKRYSIKNFRNVLSECSYKDIEDTIFDIVNFHAEMKSKDRYEMHRDKDLTTYKQHVRTYLAKLLSDIYDTCNNGDLRNISLRLSKDVIVDKLETTNRSAAQEIAFLKRRISMLSGQVN